MAFKFGGMNKPYEGSPADKAADKRNAKKAGVPVKKWEGSPADEKADAKAVASRGHKKQTTTPVETSRGRFGMRG